MPRYYFQLTDGEQVLSNHKGADLAGDAAAREVAMDMAQDFYQGAKMPEWDWHGWFVRIVDTQGRQIDEVPIGAIGD